MRRNRRKGGNKEKVFGCDLLEHLNASCQEIPQVLRCCSEFVEHNGIVDGIYRLSGVSSNIQKLRGEFECDGGPDLNKDVYLQDIHCVSSLCKAYFRELPNPLLTYQLYDKFAEAVAIQLEEERLVKIRDVLKELPAPHYRTLEFLMQHLVRMASFSSETNMHARNLAIVWAPNLLRSKDIESSGFNGTAAFMEVRVQSIVVEFILTHVPQLFPEQGVSNQRRTSLPSPSALPTQEEGLFKSAASLHVAHFGNLSPGDGPLPIRPYHAIIEGTDKRKGSLKGRKWMSIFNIGGRLYDQRRRHKHSTKEKERPALRPARSMDSLSTPSYPKDGSRVPGQRPPSTHMSPRVTTTPQSGSEAAASTGAIGASEYAVTYRRGTGLVGGGGGTQGTYTTLDPEALAGNEVVQSRSPGLSTKVGRRAAMHITGPTLVTVPLHITSTLAQGVLKASLGDKVIQRGREKDGGEKADGKEGGEKIQKKKIEEIQHKVEESGKDKKDCDEEKNRQEVVEVEESTVARDDPDGKSAATEEEVDEEARGNSKEETVVCCQSETAEERKESLNSNSGEDLDQNIDEYVDTYSDYMVMKKVELLHPDQGGDDLLEASDILNSTEMDADDQRLSGYVQDSFEFLDQMDFSAMEHLDCSVSYQINEFSVEPPGHSDDEYEMMHPSSHHPDELQTHLQSSPEAHAQSPTELKPHRPLSLDLQSRHTKSLSLPHMVSPLDGAEESSSEEDSVEDDIDDCDSSYDDDDSMFVKSLPADYFLNSLSGMELDPNTEDSPVGGPAHHLQCSDETESQAPNLELPVEVQGLESMTGDRQDKDGFKEQATAKNNEDDHICQVKEELDNDTQSEAPEDDLQSKADAESQEPPFPQTAPSCVELPQPSDKDCIESSSVEELPHLESTHAAETVASDTVMEDSRELSVTLTDHQIDVRGDSAGRDSDQIENTCQQFVLVLEKNNEDVCEEPIVSMSEGIADEAHESSKTRGDICQQLEDVKIEAIEHGERSMREDASTKAKGANDDEAEVSGEKMQETKREIKNREEVGVEVEDDPLEVKEGNPTDPETQKDLVKHDTNLPKPCDFEQILQTETASNREVQNHSEAEVTKQPEKENNEPPVPSGLDEKLKEVRESTESRQCDTSLSSVEGVGRKLVVTKNPKVYQVKAVPVVPPKPHHCKITALTLRQQQRERKDAERAKAKTGDVPADRDAACTEQEETGELKERLEVRGGDKERDRRRDATEKDTNRNSPLSMCFDEAVAIATMRREKERREGDAEAEGLGK
ncbi:unnamed protein product [Ophioblennius macclurei]